MDESKQSNQELQPNLPIASDVTSSGEPNTVEDSDPLLGDEQIEKPFLQQVEEYKASNEIGEDTYQFWLERARQQVDENGVDFAKFVKKNELERFEELGDKIMYDVESTGYGIDRFSVEHPRGIFEPSEEPAIYYSCEMKNPEHFALLLAEIQNERDKLDNPLITKDQVEFGSNFGCKANKFIWTDDYFQRDPDAQVKPFVRKDGVSFERPDVMEIVLKLSGFADMDQLHSVLVYFDSRVYKNESDQPIPGSYIDPDIRVTLGTDDLEEIKSALQALPPKFMLAIANENFDADGKGKIIVLRKETRFDTNLKLQGWKSSPVIVSEALEKYIVSFGVKP